MSHLTANYKKGALLSKKKLRMPLIDLLQTNDSRGGLTSQVAEESQPNLKRSKSYKSQKEAFVAYNSSMAASRAYSREIYQ